MVSVLKEWTSSLTWKEQTVLLVALRGPDTGSSFEAKSMVRWLRSVILHNAAPRKTFMRQTEFERIQDLAEQKPLVFDMLPLHFMTHLMHAFEIVAYRHPELSTASHAQAAYFDLCDYLHLQPESPEQMTTRLRDEVELVRDLEEEEAPFNHSATPKSNSSG